MNPFAVGFIVKMLQQPFAIGESVAAGIGFAFLAFFALYRFEARIAFVELRARRRCLRLQIRDCRSRLRKVPVQTIHVIAHPVVFISQRPIFSASICAFAQCAVKLFLHACASKFSRFQSRFGIGQSLAEVGSSIGCAAHFRIASSYLCAALGCNGALFRYFARAFGKRD